MPRSRRSPSASDEENGEEYSKKQKQKQKSVSSLWSMHSHRCLPAASNASGGAMRRQLMAVITIMVLVTPFIVVYLAFSQTKWFVRVSPSIGSVSPVRYESHQHSGSGFDFGSLGVPLCRTKHGKTVEWTTEDLIKGLADFVPIYETRPIKTNSFGTRFDHSFGLWFVARWRKPQLIIESGSHRGHSTWVLRQAMPLIPIITLSPEHPTAHLKNGPVYVDHKATYFTGKDFVDFGSVDWRSLLNKYGISDPSKVLVFFDDHQNELKRIKQALKVGIQMLIFDDNFDTGTGDHYSLRQICDQSYIKGGGHSCFNDSDEARIRSRRKKSWRMAVDIGKLCGEGEAWWGVQGKMRDNFNRNRKAISHAEHFQNGRFVESVLDVYWEVPPVAGLSLTQQNRYDPARASSPIVEDGNFDLFQKLGLSKLDPWAFNGYVQMVYAQISAPNTSMIQ